MRKINILLVLTFFTAKLFAQGPIAIIDVMAYKGICEKYQKLPSGWLSTLGQIKYGSSYKEAIRNKDEFKLGSYNAELNKLYENAKTTIKAHQEYYLTELIPNYSYDFATEAVKLIFERYNVLNKLDCYEEGLVFGDYSHSNPELKISNFNNIPTQIEMPKAIAERSFNQRKGTNRPPFKLRYYFKFWNCGELTGNDDWHSPFHVEITKVILLDDFTNYSKEVVVEPGRQPVSKTENIENKNQKELENNEQKSNTEKSGTKNLGDKQYEVIKQIDKANNFKSRINESTTIDSFNGKYISSECKKGYFEFSETDIANFQVKTNRRNCINLLGNEKLTYKYDNGMLFYELGNSTKNGKLAFNVMIVFIDTNNELVVVNYATTDNGEIRATERMYKKE